MRRTLSALLTLAVLGGLAGCGGGDDDASADEPVTSTTADGSTDDGATDGAASGEAADPQATGDGPAVPSSGCDSAPHAPSEGERVDTTSGGAERWYLVTAPEDEEPLPLVVDMHGFMEGAEVHALMSDLGTFGLQQGFVTVFPHGTGDPVQWGVGLDSPDLDFIDAVVAEVTASRCIDTSRVYATGLSMGAMMTSLLACTRADTFAAFAPVNGIQLPDGCAPARPVPVLAFHGTADPILLFNGGVDTSSFTGGEPGASATIPEEADLDGPGYPATLASWADLQGCTDPVDVEEAPVVDRTWTCPAGAALEFVIVEGQGHGWPGSEFAESIGGITGPQADGVDANTRIWEFFQQHQLPAE